MLRRLNLNDRFSGSQVARRKLGLTKYLILPVAFISLACSSDPTPSGGSSGSPDGGKLPEKDGGSLIAPGTSEDTLQALGVNTDVSQYRDEVSAKANPDGYNPLGTARTILKRTSELAIFGLNLSTNAEKNIHFFDDLNSGTDDQHNAATDLRGGFHWDGNILSESVDTSLNGLEKAGVAFDIDGDGLDETFLVYFTATNEMRIQGFANSSANYEQLFDVKLGDITAGPDNYSAPDVIAADVDGDGLEEIIVARAGDDNKASISILKHDKDGFHIAGTKDYPGNLIRVAAADIDADGIAELAVAYSETNWSNVGVLKYEILDDLSAGLTRLKEGTVASEKDGKARTAVFGDLSFADFDGDREAELLLVGYPSRGAEQIMLMIGGASKNYEVLNSQIWDVKLGDSQRMVRLESADFDGDGQVEILLNRAIVEFDPKSFSYTNSYSLAEWAESRVDYQATAIGDFNGDGKPDIIYYDFDDDNVWVYSHQSNGYVITERLRVNSRDENRRWATLISTNVDSSDSGDMLLEYTGEHYVEFGPPNIIAAVAAPPCSTDLNQSVDIVCISSYGTSKEVSSDKEQSVGYSVGFTFGFEHEVSVFGVKQFSIKLTSTIEAQMDKLSMESVSKEVGITYIAGGGENNVIFAAVPTDTYVYKVLSADDPSIVGKHITVGVPREIQTYKVSSSFYNKNNGIYPDIDENVFSHTPGDIHSYPSAAEKTKWLSDFGGVATELSPVGQGNGGVEMYINESSGKGSGVSKSLSMTREIEISAGSVVAGVSIGFHRSQTTTTTVTDTTSFSAVVSDIPGDLWATEHYSWGMFVYPYSGSAGSFQVINFWVE